MPDTAIGDPTLEDVKREVARRTEKHLQPFGHVLREDVDGILKSLSSLDRDQWAGAWCKVGLAYEAQGDELSRRGTSGKEIGAMLYRAYDYCRIGRYPCASTAGTKEAYRHSLRIFHKAAQYFDRPLTVVELGFGERKLIGYLQIPRGVTRPPVVFHWGGVDAWKEDRGHINNALHRLGLASLVIDMPGTGESPVMYSQPEAEQTYSASCRGRTLTVSASGCGVEALARIGPPDSPIRRRNASRRQCFTAEMSITGSRRSG